MRRAAIAGLLFWYWVAADAAVPNAQLPLEYYANLPYVHTMALSPDGARVAIVHNIEGNSVLVVRRPGDEAVTVLLTGDNENGNIRWVRWANSEHVLVSARYSARRGSTVSMETRLLSIPAKGGEPRSLLRDKQEDRWGRGDKGTHVPQFQDQIVDMLPDDPKHILVAWDLEERDSPGVYRVNVTNSRRTLEHKHRDGFNEWLTDQQHDLRVGVERRDDELAIHVRRTAREDFVPLWRYRIFSPDTVEPLGFGLDPNVLYVRAYHEGFLAVFAVHLDKPDARELVLALPGQDVQGRLFHSRKTGDAVGLVSDSGRMRMWEAGYLGFVGALEKAFPDVSVSLAGMSDNDQRYLLLNSGNHDPGTYYFGDRQSRQVSPIAYRYPQLTAELLIGKRAVRYSARDGVAIEGNLTLPAVAAPKNLPAVVLPHSDSMEMSQEGFDYWSEFLANRGYAVLQMNFRGSTSYGVEFVRSGLQGWRRGMQDDVIDGARWLVEQGIADPGRICVVGASYGGYAALMGAIEEPALFRCAVSFAGVTDLVDLVEYANRFENSEVLEVIVGTDKAELRRHSPVALADKVGAPVLLVHGVDDRVVRLHHGRSMQRALQRAGKPHKYVEQAQGNHYLSSQAQRHELFRELESFLAQHLGPDPG